MRAHDVDVTDIRTDKRSRDERGKRSVEEMFRASRKHALKYPLSQSKQTTIKETSRHAHL